MTTQKQIYRCPETGLMVEVLIPSDGELTCNGKPMKLLKENTTDAATEKHVPVIEAIEGGYKVSVGSVEHPMTPEHYIQWIELITENGVLRQDLQPTDKPVAVFKTDAKNVSAREYCNLHGLWKAE